MTDSTIEGKAATSKADEWAERIAAQQRSGMSVKQFCKDQRLTEYSFYAWRKRLQKKEPVRFALVKRTYLPILLHGIAFRRVRSYSPADWNSERFRGFLDGKQPCRAFGGGQR